MKGFAPVFEIRMTNPAPGTEWRRLLTHVEIRRVQNGFVVMGFNVSPRAGDHWDGGQVNVEKACFVCETPQSLAALIESLTTDTGDFAWQATVDLPITDLVMTRRIRENESVEK